jgi:two-component system nitrate/nitrite response regulator NarL
MESISIAVVDDHPIVLEALVRFFSDRNHFRVVATGRSVPDATQIAASHRLDVLVLDPTMQGDAFSAIARIKSEQPLVKIVAFSAAVGADYAVRALEAGANGYVLKSSAIGDLENAIRTVLNGETFVPPSFASRVINALRDANVRKRAVEAIKLSIREEQVIRLLLRGKTNKEIAQKLAISEKTVKYYMTNLMQKLNARNRTEAAIAAQRFIVPDLRDPALSKPGMALHAD